MEKLAGDYNAVGEFSWRWCKECWDRTEQVWDGQGWVCLGCHPEKRPAVDEGSPDV